MDRTQGANYDASTGVRLFTDGPPGTTVEEDFLNGVQEELIHAINSFAITPSISDRTQLMSGLGLLGLGMRNGVITPSTAVNNLTVAIKTLAGTDPSTTNPVHVRIGNTIRKITSALYITLTGGTDDWDRTSYTYSVFVYLGWDSVNSRVEICLCPMPTYLTYPAANPAAPSAKRIRSAYGSNTGTAITNGHTMQVVGRVDTIVQSAADNYTSVSSTAISNPIYFSPYQISPEVPTKTAPADTTPVFSTNNCYFCVYGNKCTVQYYFSSDGGVDGAGGAGNLGLALPFTRGSAFPNSTFLDTGINRAANYDGAALNHSLHFIASGGSTMIWRTTAVVAGSGDQAFTPGDFTNGVRDLYGQITYMID